jgi:hypothetical protein
MNRQDAVEFLGPLKDMLQAGLETMALKEGKKPSAGEAARTAALYVMRLLKVMGGRYKDLYPVFIADSWKPWAKGGWYVKFALTIQGITVDDWYVQREVRCMSERGQEVYGSLNRSALYVWLRPTPGRYNIRWNMSGKRTSFTVFSHTIHAMMRGAFMDPNHSDCHEWIDVVSLPKANLRQGFGEATIWFFETATAAEDARDRLERNEKRHKERVASSVERRKRTLDRKAEKVRWLAEIRSGA